MRAAKVSWLRVIMLCLCFGLILSMQSAWSQEKAVPEGGKLNYVVLRVHFTGGPQPNPVTIKPGPTVIWINDGNSHVQIKFVGTGVRLACGSPVHFAIDQNGMYNSDYIALGATASLCFVVPGEYDYVMTAPYSGIGQIATPKEYKGKVIVSKE